MSLDNQSFDNQGCTVKQVTNQNLSVTLHILHTG